MAMAQLFRPNLAGSVLSLAIPIHDICDVRLWRSSYGMRAVIRDLCTIFNGAHA